LSWLIRLSPEIIIPIKVTGIVLMNAGGAQRGRLLISVFPFQHQSFSSAPFHHDRAAVHTSEEVRMVAALGQVYHIFAMKYIERDCSSHIFTSTKVIRIAGEDDNMMIGYPPVGKYSKCGASIETPLAMWSSWK